MLSDLLQILFRYKFSFLFLLFAGFSISVNGQMFQHTRSKQLKISDCEIILDSLHVFPESIVIIDLETGMQINNSLYSFSFDAKTIRFDEAFCDKNPNIQITYNVFPINLAFSLSGKDTTLLSKSSDSIQVFEILPPLQNDYLTDENIIRSGNISRGISVGNTQGASLQSSLDIRLQGRLSGDIDVVAVITDNNIPVQPDGTTQQLQEFDKVFIRLSKDNTMLTAGDIDLLKPEGYFMNYTKKSQGVVAQHQFSSLSPLSEDSLRHAMYVSGGVSKGKFARNSFSGSEGNQGPYKLSGNDNELYIVILAGTERVFINGELLTRGNNNDYVIDYNTAELRFTGQRLITSVSRITIEFEYTDKNYMRSLFTGGYSVSGAKGNAYLHFYSEQDARNQSLQQELNEDERFYLQLAGDNTLGAIVPSWDSVAFSGDYVSYKMIDTLGYDSVFLYSIHPDSAFYRVTFSFVGTGKGNYVLDQSSANGRVFKWVVPISGISQGDYEPVRILIPPRQQQMVSAGAQYLITKNTTAGFEIALSQTDANTFSSFDDKDNLGTAATIFIRHQSFLGGDSITKSLIFLKELKYEFVEKRFVPIDRFRSVEFSRDWNMNTNDDPTNEHVFSVFLSLNQEKKPLIKLSSGYFLRAGQFNSFQTSLGFTSPWKALLIQSSAMYTISERTSFSSGFFKHKSIIASKTLPLQIGCGIEQESSLFSISTDSLLANSYSFIELEPFIASAVDSSSLQYKIWYKHRNTSQVYLGELTPAFYSREAGLRFFTNSNALNRISLQTMYRITELSDTVFQQAKADNSLLSRFDHQLHAFDGAIQSLLYYEIGAGLEAKKEFSYLEVAAGQGQYAWNDYNNNGVKELDEFEVAQYQDEASYIRIYMPTNEYIRVFGMQFNESLIIEPSRSFGKDTLLWKQILSRFSDRFLVNLNRKTTSEDLASRIIPLWNETKDTGTVYSALNFRNTVYFNRSHPKFSAWYTFSEQRLLMNMVQGNETKASNSHEFRMIWNMTKSIGIDLTYKAGNKENSSAFFNNRNYNIDYWDSETRLNFQPGTNTRLSLYGRIKESKNQAQYGNQQAQIITIGPEFRLPMLKNHTLSGRIMYHYITYNDVSNTPIAFEILESLEPGQNFTWNLNAQITISKMLQLQFSYEGRKPETDGIIHFGSVQLRALL